jgi:hypothetical protein
MKLFAICCLLVEGFVAAAPTLKLEPSPSKAAQNASTKASNKDDAPPAAAQPVKRARLDVGFASFEKNMMQQILVSIQNATVNGHWTPQLQVACKDNVSQALSQGLKSQLASLKQGIGKTWMALPEDEQKNAYVDQLRSSYEPVFKDTLDTIGSHLIRSLKRVQVPFNPRKKVSDGELLAGCESSIVGNILNERCYDIGGASHQKKVNSFLELKGTGAPKNFCMPSVFEAMNRRLKDSQGLIGMTMQFEAKSLTLSAAPSAVDDIVQQVGAVSH